MKVSILSALLILCLSAGAAMAQEPCPTAVPNEQKMVDPKEKCKPELGETAPVLFVFPDENKENAKSAKENSNPVPASDSNPAPAADITEKKSP